VANTASLNQQTIHPTETSPRSYFPSNKGTAVPVHSTKAHRGSRGTPPLIFNLGKYGDEWPTSRPGRVVAGTRLRYPLDRSVDGPQIRSGSSGRDKGLLFVPRFELRTVRLWNIYDVTSSAHVS